MSQDILYHQLDQFMQAFLPMFTPHQQGAIQSNWTTFTSLIQSKPPLDYDKIHLMIHKMHIEEESSSQNPRSSVGNPTMSRATTQQEERNQSCSKNLSQGKGGSTITAASSPRLISTVSKNPGGMTSTSNSSVTGNNNLFNKFSQLDSMQSPKVALSNLASQQQLMQKNSLQTQLRTNQVEEFNRHMLFAKTKELLFTLSVSTDKLNAMARLPMFSHQKENFGLTPKSPLKTHATTTTAQIQHLQSYQMLSQQHISNTSQQMHFGYPLQNQVYQPMYVNTGAVKPRGSNHSAEHYSIPQRAII